jgi:hypothetical protein
VASGSSSKDDRIAWLWEIAEIANRADALLDVVNCQEAREVFERSAAIVGFQTAQIEPFVTHEDRHRARWP